MKAWRGEILSVPDDPHFAGADAIRHFEDGLLVVENGLVLACGPHAELADKFAEVPIERLEGLIVPGFVDAHVHYPQIGRIASHGEQLMQWLERHIFPAEMAFADRGHADEIAAFFLDELLRHGTTSALVFATVHAGLGRRPVRSRAATRHADRLGQGADGPRAGGPARQRRRAAAPRARR